MKKIIIAFLIFVYSSSYGNGITVSGISFNEVTNEISFSLEWENSFFVSGSTDLFDAVWVYIKYAPNGGDIWYHAEILDSIPVANFIQYISYDDLGIMIYNSQVGNKDIPPTQFTLELSSLLGGYQDFKVFATEMVFKDQGAFFAGDGFSEGRFYANGDTTMGWEIVSELGIQRGNSIGTFNQVGSSSTANLTSDFPKGYESIFSMKYKITAQQYVDFLNCLTRTQQDTRVQTDLSGLVASNKYVMTDSPGMIDRNPIACDVNIGTGPINFFLDLDDTNPPNSSNDGANIALNYLSSSDIFAYLDWAGLRPISELEYESICRGKNMPPIPGEYAWGTATYNAAGSITNAGTNSESSSNVGVLSSLFKIDPLRAGYAATSTSNRTAAGATFWGNMDVHNLGELLIGVESSNFSRFDYGDGNLNATGNAEVPGWTNGVQLLSTQDSSSPSIESISKVKTIIGPQLRSAHMGARGVRRLIL